MERPALQRLLSDVRAGRVDVIVVYKADRLTRALSDFAKIVEIPDGAGPSFVSVTQAFNTTTSMGRLTLNVLLSFAQFKREVISERVRDKVAASKARGIWMGGPLPLGYNVCDRKLVANDVEAETVRHIFQRYLALDSVPALLDEMQRTGVVTKRQTLRDGEVRGGISFRRGALYHVLKNRIYRGDIVHHDNVYPGEHDGIVPEEIFDAVQARLAANTADYRGKTRASSVSLLAGLIRDQSDRPLSPSHAVKAGKRYRYYVTNTAVPTDEPARVLRFPAMPLEAAIIRAMERAIEHIRVDGNDLSGVGVSELATIERAKAMLVDHVKTGRTSAVRPLLLAIDLQVEASPNQITTTCCRRKMLEQLAHTIDWTGVSGRVVLTVETQAHHNGQELKLRINPSHNEVANPNEQLVALIVRAHAARDLLIAQGQLIPTSRKRELLRMARAAYLAPDIITAIFEGRQPRALTARAVDRVGRMPICWREQRQMLGFN